MYALLAKAIEYLLNGSIPGSLSQRERLRLLENYSGRARSRQKAERGANVATR
jgi:hypothetical protein